MNYKNNLSLILASTMVSGMFSAAVNATAYKFRNTTGNLAVHAVSSKNVVALEDSEDIALDLSASETPSQKFAFSVSDDVINENVAKATGNKTAADADMIKRLKNKAVEATEALKNAEGKAYPLVGANTANDINNGKEYAKAFKKAVEAMAEINGEMSDKSNAKELMSAVKDLVLAYSAAMKKVHTAQNAVANVEVNSGFVASALATAGAAANEDAATTVLRLARSFRVVGGGAAAQRLHVGICMGENVTGIPDAKKYKVVGSGQVAGNIDLNAGAANELTTANAACNVEITDTILDAVGTAVAVGAAAQEGNADASAAQTFLTTRVSGNDATSMQNAVIRPQADVAVTQYTDFATWAQGWFYVRAYKFLTAAEAVPAGATNASWLGAGAVKSLNAAGDYEVTVALKKGSDAVAVRKYTDSKVTLGGENGAAVTPIVVEFVPKTVTKDTTVEGTLKITSAGKTQRIKIEGRVSKDAYDQYQDDIEGMSEDSDVEVLWDNSLDELDEDETETKGNTKKLTITPQTNKKSTTNKQKVQDKEKEITITVKVKGYPDNTCNVF